MKNAQRPNKTRPRNHAGNKPNSSRNNNAGKRRSPKKSSNAQPCDSSVRTPSTIIQALSRSMSTMKVNSSLDSNPYVLSRLSCKFVPRSPSIPDGSSGRHICIPMYSVDRLSFNGTGPQSLGMNFNPWFPTCISVDGAANCVVNGITYTANPASLIGCGIPAKFLLPKASTRPGASTNNCDLYNAVSMRIVSQTHSIMYTGPTNSCSGVIRSWPNKWNLNTAQGSVSSYSSTATAPTTGLAVQSTTNAAWTTWAPIGTEILTLDGSLNNQPPPCSVAFRPEQGLLVRLAHQCADFKSVPVRNIPPALVSAINSTSITAVGASHLFGETPTTAGLQIAPNVLGFDNDWTSQRVLFSNVNQDASFEITTCMCVEFTVLASSVLAEATKESPPANVAAIKYVNTHIEQHGTAIAMK